MKATDYFKNKVKSGELTADEALAQALDLFDVSSNFIDNLIQKYTEQKTLAIKNSELFKGSSKREWYESTFVEK